MKRKSSWLLLRLSGIETRNPRIRTFTCYVSAKDGGILDPGEHSTASGLNSPIYWVDSNGPILDENLVLSWGGVRCRLDFERGGL
jgi:hypothetical protein